MNFSITNEFIPSLKGAWDQLLTESVTDVPFLHYEYLKQWWQTRGGGEWPENASLLIITATEDDRLVGVAPLFLNPDNQGSTLMFLGSKEICDYLDVIVRPQDLDVFISGLLSFLSNSDFPHWDQIIFYNLIENSRTVQALERAASLMKWNFRTECVKHSPFVILPGNWETYLESIDKKQRHEIRRKMRRVQESSSSKWYIVSDSSALDHEIEAFFELMMQDAEKSSFLTAPMREQMRRTIQWAFKENCLQLSFLEIEGQKAASYFCFDYHNQILVYNSGFNSKFKNYSPGWVLLGSLLQWANENKREVFDFMRGNEEYKYRFGGRDRFVVCVIIHR